MSRITMKLGDYLKENIKKIDPSILVFDEEFQEMDNDEAEYYNGAMINVDEDFEGWDSDARRPYYRIRGKRVNEEQAFDVISRTDDLFEFSFGVFKDLSNHYVYSYHFRNMLFANNHFPKYMGWIKPDGMVGGSGITDKYPNAMEVLDNCYELTTNFDFLDMVIAITEWNEIPPEIWDGMYPDEDEENEELEREADRKHELELYEGFEDAIEILFHINNKMISIYQGEEAKRIYREYNSEFSPEDEESCTAFYHTRRKTMPCDRAYLARCLENNGYNGEEEIKNAIAGRGGYVLYDFMTEEEKEEFDKNRQ